MITPDDVINSLKSRSNHENSYRNANLHGSSLSICGFKYRYELSNHINAEYSLKFLRGKSIEDGMFKAIQNVDKSYVDNVSLKTDFYGLEVISTPDFVSVDNAHVIEFKTSGGDKYKDIYERQLYMYMYTLGLKYGKKFHGSLWLYNTYKDTLESIGEYDNANEDILDKSISSFIRNKYIEGIENSLCGFCANKNCQYSKK
jgi:hypothetical protein